MAETLVEFLDLADLCGKDIEHLLHERILERLLAQLRLFAAKSGCIQSRRCRLRLYFGLALVRRYSNRASDYLRRELLEPSAVLTELTGERALCGREREY